MARALTAPQRALLRSDKVKANLLMIFYLDSGTVYFCDNVEDMTDGTNTYIGASSIADQMEIRSGGELAAEPITLIIDGNKLAQYGVSDPGHILREMLDALYVQRRVDTQWGIGDYTSQTISLVLPVHAGKINSARLIDPEIEAGSGDPGQAKLEVVIDALASRYNRATNRTRSHADQLELDNTDMFFSLMADALQNERTLYWGRKPPKGTPAAAGNSVYNQSAAQTAINQILG